MVLAVLVEHLCCFLLAVGSAFIDLREVGLAGAFFFGLLARIRYVFIFYVAGKQTNNQYTTTTTAMLVMLPLPDFSMPFNVLTLSSTALALFFGSIFNVLVRPVARSSWLYKYATPQTSRAPVCRFLC